MSSFSSGMWMRLLRELAGQTRSGFSPQPTCLVGVQLHLLDGFGQGTNVAQQINLCLLQKCPSLTQRLIDHPHQANKCKWGTKKGDMVTFIWQVDEGDMVTFIWQVDEIAASACWLERE